MHQSSIEPPSYGAIMYMVHHMFLPPKLPQEDDASEEYETALVETTINALREFKEHVMEDPNDAMDTILRMITTLKVTGVEAVDEISLLDALRELPDGGGIIPLHIRAQNAGVLLSKVSERIHVEVFELSPLNNAVVTTKGRLRRSFPGFSLALDVSLFREPNLQAVVAHALAKMSHQTAVETKPQVLKAGQMHDEIRDTTHPKIVTELFMGFLRPMGEEVVVPPLWKNTRDEVFWCDALLPWRRSPVWLLLRVSLHLVFSRLLDSKGPSEFYKTFMVFLMAKVLRMALQNDIPCDMLYAMTAKLGRRLLKLDLSVPRAGVPVVQSIMHNATKHIRTRWGTVIQQASPCHDMSVLKTLDFDQDVFIRLESLAQFVNSFSTSATQTTTDSFQPTSTLAKYDDSALPTSLGASKEYVVYNLKAFEAWVASHLPQWIEHHIGDADTCEKLGTLIATYYHSASSSYSKNPEALSTLLLTTIELWIACDQSALHLCQFLEDYDPGIPVELFQSLILPFKSEMQRLLHVEEYLRHRRLVARHPSPSIFRDFGRSHCFAVRYFDQSFEHQRLRQEIELRAAETRRLKVEELLRKKEDYRSLMRRYEQGTCDVQEVVVDYYHDIREERHSGNCRRCNYKSQACGIDIKIHEWPLPADDSKAKSTVFELNVPPFFGHWRDTTFFCLREVFKEESPSAHPRAHHPLSTYRGLQSFFTPHSSGQRLILLSETKPHGATHRRRKSTIAATTADDVCLNNGLHYRYYDENTGTFLDDSYLTDEITMALTYQLPSSSSALQKFLLRPFTDPNGPPPNTVIAGQSNCPEHMSLDEFKALCTIPLGTRIQWQNILLQLSAPSVDFKKVETSLIILQSIYQAGPYQDGSVLRESHETVSDLNFASALLKSLNESVQRIQENWESSHAISIFISICARLLSLTASENIQAQCLAYLQNTRTVTFGWVNLLTGKAYRAGDDFREAELLSHAVELALICINTFNVDDRHLDRVLALPEDASVFIQCCILIQNNTAAISGSLHPMIPILHHRWKALCYRSYLVLSRGILGSRSQSLDNAIRSAWSAYVAGAGWGVVSDEHDYWLVNTLSTQKGQKPMRVHYNLLTGELLVNGLPLARLPPKYWKHPTYRVLFGQSNLEVMPTTVNGMQFSGKRDHMGNTVHLGVRPISGTLNSAGSDLLVRAVKDHRTYDLVPPRILCGEFPAHFTDRFVHWYDATEDCVEFRPLEHPWSSSPENWRLIRGSGHGHWSLVRDGQSLVNFKSETARVISRILSPLEGPDHLHTVLQHSSSTLEIEIPRLSLAFLLISGTSSLRSKQFRGLAVDPDQSLGTLAGLDSKLLLRNDATSRRLVILPEGRASWQKDGDHVHVRIEHHAVVKAHAYPVDDRLGRLLDNGTLQSKLWLCYLHAVTSFCLPDPLIMRTGTEQALSILKSAAVRSFDQLTQENIDILLQIARLTPRRKYYPANERVMQTVEWVPDVGFLAQHGAFYENVKLIFDQAAKGRVFYPGRDIELPYLDHAEPDLLRRDGIRSSTFHISDFGAEDHTVEHDVTYSARDRAQNSPKASQSFIISSFVFQESPTIHHGVPWGWGTQLWKFLAQTPHIFGPDHPIPSSELKYDSRWLQDWPEVVSKHWCAIHQTLSRSYPRFDKFRLMIWLSTLAYAKDSNVEIVQTLGSFFVLSSMTQISPPAISSFHLSQGATFGEGQLRSACKAALLPFAQCPESQLARRANENRNTWKYRQKRMFQNNQDRMLNRLIQILASQWPCQCPVLLDDIECRAYVDMDKAQTVAKPNFNSWYDNYQFNQYLQRVGHTLQRAAVAMVNVPPLSSPSLAPTSLAGRYFISVDDVFAGPPPLLPSYGPYTVGKTVLVSGVEAEVAPRLASVVDNLRVLASSRFERSYVEDLQASLQFFESREQQNRLVGKDIKAILCGHLSRCETRVQQIYALIRSAVVGTDSTTGGQPTEQIRWEKRLKIATDMEQQPRVCPTFFLQQLSRHRWLKLVGPWRSAVVSYALALAELQRAERLVSLSDRPMDLIKELCNLGHTNWDPLQHPESLLLEVENGLLIRDVQEDIARQMRNVTENATMQLNMGEGKSSVIVPVVAAALADGSRLVRVIAAKPQAKQMSQMLVSKLGGLLDRRVYHMPFSRSLRLEVADAAMIEEMCHECLANGGILLVQPEHILSFKLMGQECLIAGKDAIGRSLIHTQEFFDTSSRDIVDESDENFSVKFELIYTMGIQRPIELSPRRWICIQRVLDLVKAFAPRVAQEDPHSIEIHGGTPGMFPRTRILDNTAQRRLVTRIAEEICENGLEGLPIARQPRDIRDAVLRYLIEPSLSLYEITRVESQEPGGFWTEATSNTILLLRGLLAGGVLSFALRQKRWRVQYGLDASRRPRTKLAVPYRAKDSPSLRSEFSHPDVVIVLTCLSYYYGGIGDDDLFLTFDHLLNSDQADVEYQEWVKDASLLPAAFRQLSGVNLKDRLQCVEHVFPPLRYAKNTIDYFLTHLVFPKEMREFPHKLSASGWDIGQIKTFATSGFSGTSDSRMTLPLSVRHLDLPEQRHTNALVLEHLLRPENSIKLMPPRAEASSSTAECLLKLVTEMTLPVQVILDVGAQVLELSNLEVAREWLKRVRDHEQAQAVVFFNDDDELSVVDRKGRIEPLQTSPFAAQLDVCLIFLDEAHTRGTDLRLPEYYRAAVTLGANLSKDRLIQACMRMRKLGQGQSVVFCVPEDIQRQILARNSLPENTSIGVADVLCWAITETWIDIRRSIPLWAVQGRRFEHQHQLWADARIDGKFVGSQIWAEKFLENESQSLETRYRPGMLTNTTSSMQADRNPNIQRIVKHCLQFDDLEHNTATLQEEQERELSPEIVQEREVQRPEPAEPAEHCIHPDLVAFVANGVIKSDSGAIQPAFETLRLTSAAAHIDVSQFPSDVLATVDFASTIRLSHRSSLLDAYQRPVQWILTSIGPDDSSDIIKHLVIISPYEAQMLQPAVRRSKRVTLHIYAPRPNIGIRPLDQLDLYNVSGMAASPNLPTGFVTQFNLFAGQLYLSSFKEYVEVCSTLGLAWQKAEEGGSIAADGFIIRNSSGHLPTLSHFSESPVAFLRTLMTKIRKNCEEIDKTHMGAILGGRLLCPSDFGSSK